MKKKILNTIILGILLSIRGYSQVEYPGVPLSVSYSLDIFHTPEYTLPLEHIAELEKEAKGPKFLGIFRPFEIKPDIMHRQEIDGSIVLSFIVKSPGARSIAVVFDEFDISKGTSVFFHSDNKVYGAYNYRNVSFLSKKEFAGPEIGGESCIVEINVPIDELDKNSIRVSGINHFIYSTADMMEKSAEDYSCTIDVNCTEGDAWCNQIRSVAYIQFRDKHNNFLHACSGALVNNVQNNFKQYLLTARHCTNDNDINWNTVKFIFNYQLPLCSSGSGNSAYWAVNGGEELDYCVVSWSDNSLIEILESIPIHYNVYYSGVDITARSLYDALHCIHHPSQKPKKLRPGNYNTLPAPNGTCIGITE